MSSKREGRRQGARGGKEGGRERVWGEKIKRKRQRGKESEMIKLQKRTSNAKSYYVIMEYKPSHKSMQQVNVSFRQVRINFFSPR